MVARAALARNIIGIAGNVISFGMFLSPAPTFVGIIKKKAVEEFKPDPYIATVLNCAFWVFYGMPFVHPNSILVVTINGIGLVFEFVYLSIYYAYATNKGRFVLSEYSFYCINACACLLTFTVIPTIDVKPSAYTHNLMNQKKVLLWLLVEVIFFAAVALVTMLALHGTKKRSLIVGILCDVFNVMMYASPLTIMAKVIKTKSVKYMPFWLSLANFCNGVCWTTYALIHPFDIYVLISNGLGAIAALAQLILYACYCSCKPEEEDDDHAGKKPSDIQLSDRNRAATV